MRPAKHVPGNLLVLIRYEYMRYAPQARLSEARPSFTANLVLQDALR
jgi:hypothetical protein